MLERGNWASNVVWGNPDLGMAPYDPAAWAKEHQQPADKAIEGLTDLVLQGDLGEQARAMILQAAKDGKPDSLRKALQLTLHCPEFQLA